MANIGSYPLNEIITGDSRLLAPSLPDGCLDLVFTDPIYKNIQDYEWLSKTAFRVLKDNTACLVFHGIEYLPETIEAMKSNLHYRWQFPVLLTGGKSSRFHPKGFAKWYSCLWFEKGTTQIYEHFADAQISKYNKTFGMHEWSKSPINLLHWLVAFTKPFDLVGDFFAGSGTIPVICKMTQRNFIASEVNQETGILARSRLLQTMYPLEFAKPNKRLQRTAGTVPLDGDFSTLGLFPAQEG